MTIKKMMIGIPTSVGGSMQVDLAMWMAAVEAQCTARRALNRVAGEMKDLSDRVECRKAADVAGTDYVKNRLFGLWMPPQAFEGLDDPIVPPDWDVTVQQYGGSPIPHNRNSIVAHGLKALDWSTNPPQFVDTQFNVIGMIDSDIVPDHGHLWKICEALNHDDVDIVSGVYSRLGQHGPQPMIFKIVDGRSQRDWMEAFVDGEELERRGSLVRLPGVGLPGGFLFVKRHVFQVMLENDMVWFKDQINDGSIDPWVLSSLHRKYPGDAEFGRAVVRFLHDRVNDDGARWDRWGHLKCSEDIWFCRRAHDLGFKVWVDKSIHLRHYKDQDLRQMQREHERALHRGWALAYSSLKPDADEAEIGRAFYNQMREQAMDVGKTTDVVEQARRAKRQEKTDGEEGTADEQVRLREEGRDVQLPAEGAERLEVEPEEEGQVASLSGKILLPKPSGKLKASGSLSLSGGAKGGASL